VGGAGRPLEPGGVPAAPIHTPGAFIWRSDAICVIPEIVDPAEEERVQRAPLPPEPDGLPRAGGYVIVKART